MPLGRSSGGRKPLIGLVVHAKVVGVFNAVLVASRRSTAFSPNTVGKIDTARSSGPVSSRAGNAVLGHAVLGNVQVGHDLDTGNQRLVQSTLQRYIIDDNAVNAQRTFVSPSNGSM